MRRLVHVAVLISLFLMAAGAGPHAAGAQSEGSGELDLSAMMLTPADLEDEGLEGYRLAWGGTDTLDEEYANLISAEESADETMEVLEEAGFVQSRWTMLDLPSEDDADFAARRVSIFIDEYTGSDGLSDVLDIYLDFGAEIEETSETIGDESFITSYTDTDPDTGVDITSLVVAFSYENQIGQVNISDYVTQLPDIEPTAEEIEALAERLLDRMIDVRDDGSSGIEHQVLRFESDGQFVYYNADYYTRIDDEISPRYGQDDDLLEGIDEAEQSFGMTDAYRLVQTIGSNGETYLVWNAQVRLFDDEEGAAGWVGSAAEWMEISGAEDVEEVDADLDLGDETAVVSYVSGSEDAPFYTIAIFVQIGDTGIIAQISYPGDLPDLDTVAELAETQVECVEDGGCPVETAVPDSLVELAESVS